MKSNNTAQIIQTELSPGETIYQFGDSGTEKIEIIRGIAEVQFEELEKSFFLKPGDWFIPQVLSSSREQFNITQISTWCRVLLRIGPDFSEIPEQSWSNFNLTKNDAFIMDLSIEKDKLEQVFSILKIINWAAKEYEGQLIPINQLLLRLDSLNTIEIDHFRSMVSMLEKYNFIRLLNEDAFLIESTEKIQILIEYIQEMLLIGLLNPIILNQQYHNLNKLLGLFNGIVVEPSRGNKKFEFLKICPEISDDIIRKILKLWSVKRLLRYEADSRYQISDIQSNDITLILNDFDAIAPVILDLIDALS